MTLKSQKNAPQVFPGLPIIKSARHCGKITVFLKNMRFIRTISGPPGCFFCCFSACPASLLVCFSASPFFCLSVFLLRCFTAFCFPQLSVCPASLLLLCCFFASRASLPIRFCANVSFCFCYPCLSLSLSIYLCLFLLSYPSLSSFFGCF